MQEKQNRRPEDQSGAAAEFFSADVTDLIRHCSNLQPSSLAERRLIARFGMTLPTAVAIAELAGFRVGGWA